MNFGGSGMLIFLENNAKYPFLNNGHKPKCFSYRSDDFGGGGSLGVFLLLNLPRLAP